jgi:hypothetical protein
MQGGESRSTSFSRTCREFAAGSIWYGIACVITVPQRSHHQRESQVIEGCRWRNTTRSELSHQQTRSWRRLGAATKNDSSRRRCHIALDKRPPIELGSQSRPRGTTSPGHALESSDCRSDAAYPNWHTKHCIHHAVQMDARRRARCSMRHREHLEYEQSDLHASCHREPRMRLRAIATLVMSMARTKRLRHHIFSLTD